MSTASMPSALVPDMSPMKSSLMDALRSVGGGLGTGGGARTAGEPRVADAGELGQETLGSLAEVRQVLRGDRLHVGQLHGTGVVWHAVHAHLEVQVRSSGEPGHAHEADDLFLGDVLAAVQPHLEVGEVAVEGAVTAAVVDDDALAVAALYAHEGDAAV